MLGFPLTGIVGLATRSDQGVRAVSKGKTGVNDSGSGALPSLDGTAPIGTPVVDAVPGSAPTIIDAAGLSQVTIPGGPFLINADFVRDGPDLLLIGSDGQQILIRDFFSTDVPPDLISDSGLLIDGDLAVRLAGPESPLQFAQAQNGAVASQPIGRVETVAGSVTASRVDGSTVTLEVGAAIFEGDVLETADGAAIGIVFLDDSTFALDEGARMVIDELVFDPSTDEGTSAFSIVQGAFSFVSGKIASSSPDSMVVTTPVATIGVRGTAAAGFAAAEGELNTITLLSEEGGIVGEISVTNSTGTVVLNVANASVSVNSFFTAPSEPIILTNDQVNQLFGDVLSTLPPPPDGGGVDVGAVAPGQTNGNSEPNGDGQTGDGSDDSDNDDSDNSDDSNGADNSDSGDGEPDTDGDGDGGDGTNPFDADGGGPQSDSVEGDVLDEGGDSGELLAVEVDFLDGDSVDGAEDGGSDTSVVEVPAFDTAAETPDLDVEVATGAEDTPIGLAITAALKDLDGSESLSITIDGIPSGSILTADGQTIAIEDGSATLTPADLLNLNLTPPANFSGSIDLEVTATSTESNSGATADNIETLTVVVDPVADDPTLLSAPITGDEDTPINFTGLSAALNDTDGSETLSVTIAGIPSGATLFDDLAQQVIVSGGQATIADPTRIVALDQFSITPPFNDDSDFQLTVTATSTEAANLDQASVQQIFDVTVVAVADTPTLSVAPLTVNEDTEIDFTGLTAR